MGNSYSSFGSTIEHRIKSMRNAFHYVRLDIFPGFCAPRLPTPKRTVRVPAVHSCHLNAVATVDPNSILTAGQDGFVRIYDFTDGSIVKEWNEHTDQVTKLDYALHSGRKMFLSGSVDETICLFDIDKPQSLQTFKQTGMSVEGLLFLDNHSFVSAGFNSGLLMWNSETGQVTAGASADDHFITNMSRIQHTDLVCTSGIDGTLRVWDLRTMTAVAICSAAAFPLTNCEVNGVYCLATEGIVSNEATSARDGGNPCAVQMWDLRQQQLVERFRGHDKPAVAANFLTSDLQTSDYFVSVGDDRRVVVWNVKDSKFPVVAGPLTDVLGEPCIGAVSMLSNNRLAIVGQGGLIASVEIRIDAEEPKIHITTIESQYHDKINEIWQRKLEALGFV